VVDPPLDVAKGPAVQPRHHFGIDEEVVGLEGEAPQNVLAEELEGAIQVSDRHPEDEGGETVEDCRGEAAEQGVLPVEPITEGRIPFRHEGQKIPELLKVELVVGVGIEDEVAPRGLEAAPESRSITAVHGVVDDPEARAELGRKGLETHEGQITAPVVHRHHFEVGHEARSGPGGIAHRALDVPLFVIGREDDREGSWRDQDLTFSVTDWAWRKRRR
jgi:hypothetical protein